MGAAATEAAQDAREERLRVLGLAFKRAFRALGRVRGRDTHLGAGEIGHAQFELLAVLEQQGELPAGELAAAAQLAPATVTQMLDHLAAWGHVERWEAALEGVGERDLAAAARVLERLAAMLEQAAD